MSKPTSIPWRPFTENAIAGHLQQVARLFPDGVKLTLVVREPGGVFNQFVCSNDDDLDAVVELVRWRQTQDRAETSEG